MEPGLERDRRLLFYQLRRERWEEKVLDVMEGVPREDFIPPKSRHLSYKDIAVPIGEHQTISQPSVVALMVGALELTGGDRVMEVGTGSGYQAAVLSQLVPKSMVITLERVPALAQSARQRLSSMGYHNVDVRMAGQTLGCPEDGPFDCIIVAAASPSLPDELLSQLALGGRLVIPVGTFREHELVKVIRSSTGNNVRLLGPCRFVPLVGRGAWSEN